jgi:hypothetical protein
MLREVFRSIVAAIDEMRKTIHELCEMALQHYSSLESRSTPLDTVWPK